MTGREPDAAAHTDAAWMQQTACRDQPTEWFTDPQDDEEVQQAGGQNGFRTSKAAKDGATRREEADV